MISWIRYSDAAILGRCFGDFTPRQQEGWICHMDKGKDDGKLMQRHAAALL